MAKIEFLDPEEAEKFKKQKWNVFCWTPCSNPNLYNNLYLFARIIFILYCEPYKDKLSNFKYKYRIL